MFDLYFKKIFYVPKNKKNKEIWRTYLVPIIFLSEKEHT